VHIGFNMHRAAGGVEPIEKAYGAAVLAAADFGK
jgi:hypothetical protein